jgi:hypothetical protein
MADEKDQPAPKTRAPRKKPAAAAAKSSDPTSADSSSAGAVESSESGREVMTTTSQEVATTDPDSRGDTTTERRPRTRVELNRLEFGQLYLHTVARDVVVPLDGDSAARVMAVFAGTGQRRVMRDLMSPLLSDMGNLWLAVDLREVVAISWIPGLPSTGDRVMTVDPAVPEALAS